MNDCVVVISHSNYRIKSAGVEKYISDVTELLAHHGVQSVHVFPTIEINKRTVYLGSEYVGINVNGAYEGIFSEHGLYGTLLSLQQKYDLNYVGVHLHHLHGWNLSLLEQTLKMLDLPIKIVIHDYEMICGSMLKPDGFGPVCRKNVARPDAARCAQCKYAAVNIPRFEIIDRFLAQIEPLVESIIAPSGIAGKTWVETYGRFTPKLVIREHLMVSGFQTPEYRPDSKIRLAYIGATAPHKGFEEWQQLVKQLPKEYELYYFGNSSREQTGVHKVHVDFHDRTDASMTEQLQANGIDIVFLWSTWLETYCYTAYEACSAGCFLLTVRCSGNIAAMVQTNGCGRVFDALPQCSSYLKNMPAVRSELKEYRETHCIPELTPNASLDELLFLKNDRIKNPDTTQRPRARRSRLFSGLYAATRGDYRK